VNIYTCPCCSRPMRRNLRSRGGLCWRCHCERRAVLLFDVPRVLCQHCGQLLAIRPRQLCWRCYADRAIRARYPAHVGKVDATPKLDKLPLLPILEHYPNHAILARCRHGLHDGTCPACEKMQRAGLVFTDDCC